MPSFLTDLSTLANVARDDRSAVSGFSSGYSVFNIGRRSRFSEALRGKTALNTRPFLSELKSLTFTARNHWNLGFMLQGCILTSHPKCTESGLQGYRGSGLQGDLKSQREKASIYRTECQRAGTVNPRFADYANLILDWHKRYGLKEAEMRWDNKETRLNYQHALEQFLQRQKTGDGQLVSDIARCQSSGIFEAFFSEKLPPQMLRKFGGSIPELDRGATVGQIARPDNRR